MALATPDIEVVTDEEVEVTRPWKVLLWDDPVNTIEWVTHVLRQSPFSLPKEKAEAITFSVHADGKAVVANADTAEDADRYLKALSGAQLWATVERD